MMIDHTAHWVGVWGNGVSIAEHRPEGYARNITLRYPIHMPFDAAALRITLDNFTGTEDASVTRASILLGDTIAPVSFGGCESALLPAGRRVTSDAVALPVHAGDTAYVSLYLGDYTPMRAWVAHSGPLSGGEFYEGDQTAVPAPDMANTKPAGGCYFLSDVSALTDGANRAIVCFGDSITAQAWPEYLQLRCAQEGYAHTAIVRKAASGSRILRAYTCLLYEHYGLSGAERFPHEAAVDGADTVVIFQGINDIIHPVGEEVNPFRPMSDLPTLAELTGALDGMIAHARTLGLKVWGATLLPITGWRTYAPFREELRQQFNDYIRTTPLLDGVIDFDAAVRDAASPNGCRAGVLSPDNLHPSEEGHRTMAAAVPAALLK